MLSCERRSRITMSNTQPKSFIPSLGLGLIARVRNFWMERERRNCCCDTLETFTAARFEKELEEATCMCERSHTSIDEIADISTIFVASNQERAVQEAIKVQDQIFTLCKQGGKHYIDHSFDQVKAFITQHGRQQYHWKPPKEIICSYMTSEPWVVCRTPMPDDVLQGALGNCWLLAALAALTKFPNLMEKILLTRDYCEEGIYALRLCKDGLWTTVVIDDLLPCYSDRTLLFSKATNNQLWVPLIEKAVAKLHSSYESLDSGFASESLTLLTGMPSKCITLTDKLLFKSDATWKKLLCVNSGFLMTAVSLSHNIDDKLKLQRVGLRTKHLYTVLKAKEKRGKKSVKLRDPWGVSEWKGNGSKSLNDQGVISMSFCDFLKYFSSVHMCKAKPSNHESRLRGVFSSSATDLDNLTIWRLKVKVTTKVTFGLFQQNFRYFFKANGQYPLDLRLVVLRDDGVGVGKLVGQSAHVIASYSTCKIKLHPGKYLVVPLAFNHWNNGVDPEVRRNNVVSVHSSKHVCCQKITDVGEDYGTVLADTVIELTVTRSIKHKLAEGVTRYFLEDSCGLIFVIENAGQQTLHVKCHNKEDINIISTRGTMITHDVIPPMHRQVIMVLTKREYSFSPIQHPKVDFELKNPTLHVHQILEKMKLGQPSTSGTTSLHDPRCFIPKALQKKTFRSTPLAKDRC